MKSHIIAKKFVNSCLAISVFIFIGSVTVHGIITSATAIGSSGGRITVVTTTLCPPAGTTPPCTCGTYHMTIQPSPGSMDTIFCPLIANVPITGLTVGLQSMGYLLLGNFTAAYPVMQSINWGTSYTPG